MKTLEEHRKANYEIRVEGKAFVVYHEGVSIQHCVDMYDAQDFVEEQCREDLKGYHKYICDFCNVYCDENEVEHRIADETFTAPYGSTFVLGGDVSSVAVCPLCGDDMEAIDG